MLKTGVLLLNLGTTQSPGYWHIVKFLREFLTDRRVIDIPFILRSLLVYCFILPFRPLKVSKAYRSIWNSQGSPLLVHQQALLKKISALLPETPIALGMRYGEPSIKQSLASLKKEGCQHLIVLPLFPQYAAASTGSAIAKLYEEAAQWWDPPTLDIYFDFFDNPDFIQAQSLLMQPILEQHSLDAIIYSFHGVPVRHLKKSGCPRASICQEKECLPAVGAQRLCYKAQCVTTANMLHESLKTALPSHIAFQSRLGRTPWIKPYLDEAIHEWHKLGYKNILIVCPSFTADCLETLEEVHLGFKEEWHHLTQGEVFTVSCVNDNDVWAKTIANWIGKKLQPIPLLTS